MGKTRKSGSDETESSIGFLTPDAQENYLVHLAMIQAQKELEAGTASSQVVTHFLKLGTEKAKLEREILASQKELINAKTEALESERKSEVLYEEVIAAMKSYGVSDEVV